MLDREILAPAKGATNRGVADDNTVLWQLQHLGDLTTILMQPLTGGLDNDPALIVDKRDPCFRLEIRVLLPSCLEGVLDNDVGSSKPSGDISLADRHPE